MTSAPAFHFVIVGGGTAGWLAALLLAHRFGGAGSAQCAGTKPGFSVSGQSDRAGLPAVRISLIEAPDIGIVGVGEGSTPTLRRLFTQLGIAEAEWMSACQATYKTSIRLCDWSRDVNGLAQQYSHPFLSQLDVHSELAFYSNCFKRRLGLAAETSPERFLFNGYLANLHLAPKAPAHFPFRLEYGYHFDSALLGQFLRQKAQQWGVEYLPLNVDTVQQWPDGRLKSLTGQHSSGQHQRVEGDFFIDCTGFRARLLQQQLQVPFLSFANNLFNDAAVVMPTAPQADMPVETRATALTAGWAWQIPLRHRTGNGYVYSTAFVTPQAAETELRQHLLQQNPAAEPGQARHLHMRVGQVARHWEKNCLALGLAQGFIEPLEATALHLVQTSMESFLDAFVAGGYWQQQVSAEPGPEQLVFNALIFNRFERVRDYIVAHYKLTSRSDSDYWRANRAQSNLSESLLQILDVWYRGGDLAQEISRQQLDSHFGATSWHCLLAGYQQFPPLRALQPAGLRDAFADLQIGELFSGCSLNFQPQRLLFAQAAAD